MPFCFLHNYIGDDQCPSCAERRPVLLWDVRNQTRQPPQVSKTLGLSQLIALSSTPRSTSLRSPTLTFVRYDMLGELDRRARERDDEWRKRVVAMGIEALSNAYSTENEQELRPALVECFKLVSPPKKQLGFLVNSVYTALKKTNWWQSQSVIKPDPSLFLELVWKVLADNFVDEDGVPGADSEALGLSRVNRDFVGIRLHFTTRTREEDEQRCVESFKSFESAIYGFISNQKGLVRTLLGQINLITLDALDRYAKSVNQPNLAHEAGNIGDAIRRAVTKSSLEKWVEALAKRWTMVRSCQNEPLIHVIVDRAGLPNAYGGVAVDQRATPMAFMTNTTESLAEMPMSKLRLPFIKVNLDATGVSVFRATLAHEIAHALGANPSDCNPSGHMKAATLYKSQELGYGPKILFDAYFHEALIEFSNGVTSERMRQHVMGVNALDS